LVEYFEPLNPPVNTTLAGDSPHCQPIAQMGEQRVPLAQPLDEFRLVGEQNFCGRIEQYIARDFETSVNK
jgi:hypothetical protein